MKIYICHSSKINYKKDLYEPIRNSTLNNKHEFILPHESSEQIFDSKNIIPTCDLLISEVSYPSTSMGIELGWANKEGIKIVFIYKKGTKVSKSLRTVSSEFIEYDSTADMMKKLESFIQNI